MYKKHAKFFSRPTRPTPGLETVYPSLAKAERKRANRTERERIRQRKLVEIITCKECGDQFSSVEIVKHRLNDHGSCRCSFCRLLVPKREFAKHIKESHGDKSFKTWFKRKKKDNAK